MARNLVESFINPAFVYRFSHGPQVVDSRQAALERGINCVSLAHLALQELFSYRLPPTLLCTEMYFDRDHFRPLAKDELSRQGDLVWFGVASPVVATEDFVPVYEDGNLVNWTDFPIKHVAVHTGQVDETGDPLLLHSTVTEGTNVVWPVRQFSHEHPHYAHIYGASRLLAAVDRTGQ